MISLTGKLKALFPKSRLFDDRLSLSSLSVDASLYRIEPQFIVDVLNEGEVASLMKIAAEEKIPLTIRAAGTSLSGQAQGSGILVRTIRGWKKIEILDQGRKITLGPAVLGGRTNRALAPYGTKLGPDPASIESCTIGGIAANNASGMCCGTDQNTYRTLSSLKVIFPPQTEAGAAAHLDTDLETSRERFRKVRPELVSGIHKIRSEIQKNRSLIEFIEKKFRIKNTMGYALNSFLDFEDPLDILAHLLIGSEGTLGFISEITYHTVPNPKLRACSFVVFPSLRKACESIQNLKDLGIAAAEVMDRAALKSVENQAGMPEGLKLLPKEAAVLLLEIRADRAEELSARVAQVKSHLEKELSGELISFSSDPEVYELWWKVRRGLFPATAFGRKRGTTVIIEDVAVPVTVLGSAAVELRSLLDEKGYTDAVLFGHALDGNLHFVFTQDFSNSYELNRYQSLMSALSILILDKYQGSLKAEHGTGRNMAPFLEKEWGVQATNLMWEIKSLIDPLNILNPDVILTRDPSLHLKSIKSTPPVHEMIDDCMDCGFCESSCPSQNLTITPRQRIAAFRESAREGTGKDFIQNFSYAIDQTCAADGVCATACPVGIDTGTWIKKVRAKNVRAPFLADFIARHMGAVVLLVGFFFRCLGRAKRSPRLNHLRKNVLTVERPTVIYFPSCISRSMTQSLPDAMISVLEQAGYQVRVPAHIQKLCCGLPFESKGYLQASEYKTRELNESLLELTEGGLIPVISDTSPCSLQMMRKIDSRVKIHDSVSFIAENLMTQKSPIPLVFEIQAQSIAIQSTCSSKKMGLDRDLLLIAQACAKNVIVPEGIACCGFAGDKGWSYPELTASALSTLSEQVEGVCQKGYSTSATCEMGLTRAGHIPYESIIFAVRDAIRGKSP